MFANDISILARNMTFADTGFIALKQVKFSQRSIDFYKDIYSGLIGCSFFDYILS
jgi:hypothetical protein